MKKISISIWKIILIILIVIVGIIFIFVLKPGVSDKNNQEKYSCNLDSDCVSQCRNGCVNAGWALLNPDTSECFRAWDCSCVNNQCYTDGKPRS
jgi:hypothetical protein